MEIFELRYFLAVAEQENMHRAAEKLRVSPGSLSKTISRLETELKTKLFVRDGRAIRLTDHGKLLQVRASQLTQLEESTRMEISGHKGQMQIVLAGPEVLLAGKGVKITEDLQKKYPRSVFETIATDDESAIQAVALGNAHLAIVTGDVPTALTAKIIDEARFITVVGPSHPLYPLAKAKKAVTIEEVLKYGFVSPSRPILGKVGVKQSWDGWRDDEFTRQVPYLTSSLKLLERWVTQGKALAYLPEYYAREIDVLELNVTGCPYHCVQKIKLVARKPKNTGWLNQLF